MLLIGHYQCQPQQILTHSFTKKDLKKRTNSKKIYKINFRKKNFKIQKNFEKNSTKKILKKNFSKTKFQKQKYFLKKIQKISSHLNHLLPSIYYRKKQTLKNSKIPTHLNHLPPSIYYRKKQTLNQQPNDNPHDINSNHHPSPQSSIYSHWHPYKALSYEVHF